MSLEGAVKEVTEEARNKLVDKLIVGAVIAASHCAGMLTHKVWVDAPFHLSTQGADTSNADFKCDPAGGVLSGQMVCRPR